MYNQVLECTLISSKLVLSFSSSSITYFSAADFCDALVVGADPDMCIGGVITLLLHHMAIIHYKSEGRA